MSILIRCSAVLLTWLSCGGCAQAQVVFPPVLGHQSAAGTYHAELVPVYAQDFESQSGILTLEGGIPLLTSAPGEVIAGTHSLKIPPSSGGVQFPASLIKLAPHQTYVFELRYRVLAPGPSVYPFAVSIGWTGYDGLKEPLGGPLAGTFPTAGVLRTVMRIGDANDARLYIANLSANVAIDDLRIYRHASLAGPPEPPMVSALFPRVAKYNLYSPFLTAYNNGVEVGQVEQTLARFDLVTGLEIDHTHGYESGAFALRARNPKIMLFPYHEAFVAQNPSEVAIGGSAGLRGFFNQGLKPAWFMRKPDGSVPFEPLFPTNFQLNPTPMAAAVDGVRFEDYVQHFMSDTVLPSGLWQGIHFDQAEWYPNPLLSDADPFLGTAGPLPPLDLDGDGVAEREATLRAQWRAGFYRYFGTLRRALGEGTLLFGNAGALPLAPGILGTLNGWQQEFLRLYPANASGDFDTDRANGWYQFMARYDAASRYARAPQVLNLQATGFGLGVPTGHDTPNGLADREKRLEARDYRRMRLSLATALMHDGFFGYDFVDNTSPPVWFDEYAVDAAGNPAAGLDGKGYLGQALGEASEIGSPATEILNADFENTPPAGIVFGAYDHIATDAREVIAGGQSLVFALRDPGTVTTIFRTDPTRLPLKRGTTYQVLVDYRVLDYQPAHFKAFISLFFAAFNAVPTDTTQVSALFDTDVDGAGQSGTLRLVIKPDFDGAMAQALLSDVGSVSIDNIRVLEGSGGVFRRDFEQGIALVNPTSDALAMSQQQVSGPLGRTGIRRLKGVQDPLWNNGAAVTAGITLPPGEGIILLASPTLAPVLTAPTQLAQVAATADSIDLTWLPGSSTAVGYLVKYGETGGDMVRMVAAGKTPSVHVANLQPGRYYDFAVAALDYRGIGPYGPKSAFATAGSGTPGPYLLGNPILTPGSFQVLNSWGVNDRAATVGAPPYPTTLGGLRLLVNGVPAALQSINGGTVNFLVPWEITGDHAVLELERDGVSGVGRTLAVNTAAPTLWTWDGQLAVAFKTDTLEFISPAAPARAGDRITVAVSAVGALEPPPVDGTLPAVNTVFATRNPLVVQLGAQPVAITALRQFYAAFGVYAVDFTVPAGLPPGASGLTVHVDNVASNQGKLDIR